MIYPQIAVDARRTPYQSDDAELLSQFLFQESCLAETVLKSGMFVVDGA